jgi:hypothetical protein
MKIGDHVRCPAAVEKGLGVIVGQQKLFQQDYAEAFFAGSGEVIRLPVSELLVVSSPEELIQQQRFSPAHRFLLRLFNLQTASNFKILPLPHNSLPSNLSWISHHHGFL